MSRVRGLPAARRYAAGAAALAVVGIGLAAALRVRAGLAAPAVATVDVAPGRFVREVRAEGTLEAVRATPIVVPPASERAQRIAAIAREGAPVKAGEVIVRFDAWDARRDEADGRADLRSAESKIEKTEAEAGTARRGYELDRGIAEEELDRARAFAPQQEGIFSRHEIIESRLDRSLYEAKLAAAAGKLEASGRLASTDVALGRIEAGKAALQVRKAERELASLQIEAPHDGLLVLDRGWNGETPQVGTLLWPGQKVGQLPDLSTLEARVHVLEADAAGLRAGLSATLFIEGRSGPGFPAKVARVEPVAKPRGRNSPVKYFAATLALERTEAAFMRPGQRVYAMVRLEERDGVLSLPRAALFEKDGRRFVYRRTPAGFAPADVVLGPSSVARVVVESGLSPGDRVALRDPGERAAGILDARAPGQAAAGARP